MPFDLRGPPSRWVSRGGRPAQTVRDYKPSPGLPSYESENGIILVFDLMVILEKEASFTMYGTFAGATLDRFMLMPRSYGAAAVRDILAGGEGLCCLHDSPDALWTWRPILYRLGISGLERLGSQGELVWRHALVDAVLERGEAIEAGVEPPYRFRETRMGEAIDRARALLLEHLDWMQALDLKALGHFFAAGEVNKLYKIRPGDGFAIVDPVTREELLSLCLHPETWLPDGDVALATLLLIQQGAAGEEKLLSGARSYLRGGRTRSRATRGEIKAYELERALG